MYNPKLNFHFVGIGGAGMSGLAEILLNQGFTVTGSDCNFNSACSRLETLGAKIFSEHKQNNVTAKTSLVVYSSAIPDNNPEITQAKKLNLPVVPRAAVLAELMRLKYGVAVAGSHGKTSTSSLTSAILEEAEFDPTVIIGGLVHKYGSTGKLGQSDFLVAEADESDQSFLMLSPTIAVVTNIDDEHLSRYGSMQAVEDAFQQFTSSVPFYGLAVLCFDDPRVRSIAEKLNCRKVTYAIDNKDADLTANLIGINAQQTLFEVMHKDQTLGQINLPMPGKHFMQNALAAITVGLEFEIPFAIIQKALNSFQGVARRIEVIKQTDQYTLINDYAHHPTEIKATVDALCSAYGENDKKLIVLFQPHRFSRTQECWQGFKKCFAGIDHLLLTDIYPAGENEIEGITAENLANEIEVENCQYIGSLESSLLELSSLVEDGDVLVCMGAGSIGYFAKDQLSKQI